MIHEPSETGPVSIEHAILGWVQELAPHGILVTDSQLRIQIWNLWLETHSGFKRDEMLNRKLTDVYPDLAARKMDRHFAAALSGQVSLLSAALHGYLFPFPSTVPHAGFFNMRQTARVGPLILNGQVQGTITTIEDVTQREYQNARVARQFQRQELFSWALAQLIETPDPENMVKRIFPRISAHIFVDTYLSYFLGSDGNTLYLHSAGGISPEAQEHLRVIPITQALCGPGDEEASPVAIPCIHESKDPRAAFAKELGVRAYICNPLRVGEKFIGTLAFASRTRDRFTPDEIEFTAIVAQYVAMSIDRARREAAIRKAQQELQSHAVSLEERVQERTAKLRDTIAELESFSYSLAHDVRAPLRHIRGFADVLIEDFGDQVPGEARTHVHSIRRAIQRLERLTADILEYSKVSSKPVELMAMDPAELVNDIVGHSRTLHDPGVVQIRTPLHRVMAEPSLLRQCFANLLENALKFVPADVAPRIIIRTESRQDNPEGRAEPARSGPAPLNPVPVESAPDHPSTAVPRGTPGNENRWVRIWVEDNGIGIAPEFHRKIFGIFERLSLAQEGTGIGLAIVSKAVQRMGGRLGVESESGSGSRFWIDLSPASPR